MYETLLVPLDGSPSAECVMPHVRELLRGVADPRVVFLRVIEPLPTFDDGDVLLSESELRDVGIRREAEARAYLEGAATTHFPGAAIEVMHGTPAEAIAEAAGRHGAGLIVMATHGRSGVARWILGSVAERVLRLSPVPVVMVRAEA